MKNKTLTFISFTICFLLNSCSTSSQNDIIPAIPSIEVVAQPKLAGKMVYHSYSCYSCSDSQLFLYNFATDERTILSKNWNIINPMNGHFSPDGTKIVFMGISQENKSWDVFIYALGSNNQPLNLTAYSSESDEDPKFSPDGSKIIFKQNGILKEMDNSGTILRSFTVSNSEASMPYYSSDGNAIIYAANEKNKNDLNIYKYSIATGITQPLSAIDKLEEYYPIVMNADNYLFTRWFSTNNENDQVYLGYFNNTNAVRLPFNESDSNFSDAFPVDSRTLLVSSSRAGGKGEYDLYLVDTITGKKWSLNLYNAYINSVKNDLGACYSRF